MTTKPVKGDFIIPHGEYAELRRLAAIGQAVEASGQAGNDPRTIVMRVAVSGVRHEPGNDWAKEYPDFMGSLHWAANQTLFIVAADGLSAERIHTLWSFINDGIERQQNRH